MRTLQKERGTTRSLEEASPPPNKKRPAVRGREQRRLRRQQRKKMKQNDGKANAFATEAMGADRFGHLISTNEDKVLELVAKINKVYSEKLNKPAPFMTFVFCGLQSAGKSTIMERFLNSVMNVVQDGTGTRCPLDTTCIHDETCVQPKCDLSGVELDQSGQGLSVKEVFERITKHNKKLERAETLSKEALILVYRAREVQNMRFVDTPGIIANRDKGKDNRNAIKSILESEMEKPNTRLAVLLESNEYETNDIINFCDESLGERGKWLHKV